MLCSGSVWIPSFHTNNVSPKPAIVYPSTWQAFRYRPKGMASLDACMSSNSWPVPKVLRTQKKRFPISLPLCILSPWQVFRDRLKGMASLEACLQTVRLLFPSYWKHWNHPKKMMSKFPELIFQMLRLSSFGRWWLRLQRVPKAWLYRQQWYSQWRRWSYQCAPESFLTFLYLTNPSRNQ